MVALHPLEIERDLQRFYRIDYRDRWRPGGGTSQLTYRRLLVLLDGLPAESEFRAAVLDVSPVSRIELRLVELWESWAGKAHPVRNTEEQQRERADAAEEKQEFERQREAARERNRAALAARNR
ncbi:MAG TPA: hypothetical protein DCL06_11290 [Corynebacterium variabile]|uniref:Uncharacterized protein n=1 Tax=Corynebacterium variabile TaxID=1727 RepID=A0A3B9QWD6_9CORY|nr:hypothetical protein [Corynebacterium variabile]